MTENKEEIAERILAKETLLSPNRKLLRQFDTELKVNGYMISTRNAYLRTLELLDRVTRKSFEKLTKEEMMEYLRARAHHKSPRQKKEIKKFFSWLYKLPKGQYPECVSWIKAGNSIKKKLPEEMLTQEDILKLIRACNNARDRAIVSLLYESGARISELIRNIRIKDLRFDQLIRMKKKDGNYVELVPLMLDGKTGQRQIFVSDSIQYIREWINLHPHADNRDCYLFVNRTTGTPIIGLNFAEKLLKLLAKKAGIKKRIHPHLFRHSRATHLAKHMTEQEMKVYFGWSGGSRMPATYTHLSGADLLEKIKKIHGIEKQEDDESPLEALNCFKCGEINQPSNSFCKKCQTPLSTNKAFEELDKQNKRMKFLDKMMTMADDGNKDWLALKKELFD
ncbi:tyrosine-type recombinase/integrase [Candidatus Micrarchaeota archaeon]|nr:tyrosine-type recombinase/integrase [Candidatus Micrarchaeota archaeon]